MGYLIALLILLIIASLAAAGFFMLRRPQDSAGLTEENKAHRQRNMAKALTVRIGLSVLLFLSVLGAYHLGWIAPKGVPIATK